MMSAVIMSFISKRVVFGLIFIFAVLWVFFGFACFFCFEGQEIVQESQTFRRPDYFFSNSLPTRRPGSPFTLGHFRTNYLAT